MTVQPDTNKPPKNSSAPRRRIIVACLAGLIVMLLPPAALAQPYPDRAISYIVPSSPGSSPDIVGRGLMLPAGTPKAVRDKLQAAAMQAIGMAETRKRLEELGYVTIKDTPEAFGKFLHEDIEKMARLIKQYNLKPE